MKKQLFLLFLGFLFVLTISGVASAADRNVGPGYTYSTINQAVSASNSGDHIYVHDKNGSAYTYNEKVFIKKENLTITAKGKVTVKNKVIDPNIQYIFQLSKGNILENFIIQGNGEDYGIVANQAIIKNNTIIGNVIGVRASIDHKYVQIFNNTFYNNSRGIYFDSGSYDTISGNIFTIGDTGIDIQSNPHSTITKNTFKNISNGISINGMDYSSISYNTFNNITGNGMNIQPTTHVQVGYNKLTNVTNGIRLVGDYSENKYYPCEFITVHDNSLKNCKYALKIEGATNNTINRNIISTNTVGITFDEIREISGKVFVASSNNTIIGNNIYNNGNGISFVNIFAPSTGNKIKYNRIVNNDHWAVVNYSNENISAYWNWWGSNSSPKTKIIGKAIYDPWLVLTLKAVPSTVQTNTNSKITADLRYDSIGKLQTGGYLPNGIRVNFATTLGTIGSSASTVNGIAQTNLTSGTLGTSTVSAKLDNQTVKTSVKIIDTIPPKVLLTNPTNWKTGFSKTSSIAIKFSEYLKTSTYYNHITIKNLTTGKYVTITKSITRNTLYLKMPLTRLAYNWYQVTIPKDAIKDYAGNNLSATYTFRFKTGA
ncbi:right-handed parallel beta-helix repeat-containing protein [Methanobacterium spitsbergense]|uniref:Right-handed parallel beta-helix repeat-containing protein n=1 Tax=Methanobacterium spitsbergense TaxID=2874285 RepID=A0A8T5UTT4_9EURY|nr:right-handed parallel beta-helix repeat-containing protein [Methanobacterium spitsbergense]MBZ2164620.1 right-handed parallel beta-helix repeat-containing protein [Methanobacterium spitsbergense]